jgi:hypothetical protein
MATSTNKAKNFFEQRKNATKTATIVEAAATTTEKQTAAKALSPKPQGLQLLLDSEKNDTTTEITTQKKATGKKTSMPALLPPELKNFIETNDFESKINVNLPVEIDNKAQIALLQLKSKYGLNNRQMNKTVLLSYIIDKALRENKLFIFD